MSPRLPRITADRIIRVLEITGFHFSRQSGSYKIYINASGKRTTVPFHTGKILHPKTLLNIMRDAEINRKDLIALLRQK